MLTALIFLTALPLPQRNLNGATLARSLVYFPLAGLLIGAILALLDWLLALVVPPVVGTALVLLAVVLLTRALHLDGLIDSCDGLFGGFTPERRLEILRDSRVGAFGVLGAISVLLLRYSCLLTLSGHWRLLALLLAPLGGRWAIVLAVVGYRSARATGLGASFKEAARWWHLAVASVVAVVLCAGVWWPWGGLLLLLAGAVALAVAQFCQGRLGGLTGDCYGAVNEVVEGAIVLLFVVLQTVGHA